MLRTRVMYVRACELIDQISIGHKWYLKTNLFYRPHTKYTIGLKKYLHHSLTTFPPLIIRPALYYYYWLAQIYLLYVQLLLTYLVESRATHKVFFVSLYKMRPIVCDEGL